MTPPKKTRIVGSSMQRQVRRSLGFCLLVHWVDSAAKPGWNQVDASGLAYIVSVGVLVRWTEKYIVLAMGISSSGSFHEQITIPTACINNVHRICDFQIKPNV